MPPPKGPPPSVFAHFGDVSAEIKAEQRAISSFVNTHLKKEDEDDMLQQRLNTVLRTLEWWELLGCPLCFAQAGDVQPDHDLTSCVRPEAALAKQILYWLNNLAIPHLSDARPGACTICEGICAGLWAGAEPCDEVRLGKAIHDTQDLRLKELAINEYHAKGGKSGRCWRKSLICQVIAALCACRNQLFCGVLVELVFTRDLKGLMVDKEARTWFQNRVSVEGYWVPGVVLAYEMLVLAFYDRQNRQRGSLPLYGFPQRPAGYGPLDGEISKQFAVDNVDELIHLEECLEWWRGLYSYCVGRGLPRNFVMHTLRDCKRRPHGVYETGLGAAVYLDKVLSNSGCHHCHLPYPFGHNWARLDDGEWAVADVNRRQCQYGDNYVTDIVLGLYCSGRSQFRERVIDWDTNWQYFFGRVEGKRIASYLARNIVVEGVNISNMLRVIGFLTTDVWNIVSKNGYIVKEQMLVQTLLE